MKNPKFECDMCHRNDNKYRIRYAVKGNKSKTIKLCFNCYYNSVKEVFGEDSRRLRYRKDRLIQILTIEGCEYPVLTIVKIKVFNKFNTKLEGRKVK